MSLLVFLFRVPLKHVMSWPMFRLIVCCERTESHWPIVVLHDMLPMYCLCGKQQTYIRTNKRTYVLCWVHITQQVNM